MLLGIIIALVLFISCCGYMVYDVQMNIKESD